MNKKYLTKESGDSFRIGGSSAPIFVTPTDNIRQPQEAFELEGGVASPATFADS